MASADKDGRIAQMLSDRLACLAIEMNESMNAAADDWRDRFGIPEDA